MHYNRIYNDRKKKQKNKKKLNKVKYEQHIYINNIK